MLVPVLVPVEVPVLVPVVAPVPVDPLPPVFPLPPPPPPHPASSAARARPVPTRPSRVQILFFRLIGGSNKVILFPFALVIVLSVAVFLLL